MATSVPGKNYYSIRNKLLSQSLVFSVVIDKLRKYYGIPGEPPKPSENTVEHIHKAKNHWVASKYPDKVQKYFRDFKAKYGKSSDDNYLHALAADKLRREVFSPIHRIADLLILNRNRFEEYILFNIYPEGPPSQVRLVLSRDFPVEEPGVYLKILPNTKMSDLVAAYKQNVWLAKNLFRDQYGIKARRKSTSYSPKKESALYSEIESEIKDCYQKKADAKKAKDTIRQSDYGKIVDSAIEQLVASKVPDTDNDNKWQKAANIEFKRLTTNYYAITARYNLPTIRDLSSFLRLIPNN